MNLKDFLKSYEINLEYFDLENFEEYNKTYEIIIEEY